MLAQLSSRESEPLHDGHDLREKYDAGIDLLIADFAKCNFAPTRSISLATSSCFCGYRNSGELSLNDPRIRNRWFDPNDVDSLCSLVSAIDLYKQPDFDVIKARQYLCKQPEAYDDGDTRSKQFARTPSKMWLLQRKKIS